MDRSQIIPHRRTYLIVACVVLIALSLLAAGCTSTDTTKSASTSTSSVAAPSTPGDGVQNGDMVEIEYTGTLANGSVFDSSKDRGPFQFVIGTGTAITGFDNEVRGMKVGESKKFTLAPEQAYGLYDPSLIKSMPIDFVPKDENVTIGDTITLFNGQAYFPAKVIEMNTTNITFDLNAPLAGQTLTFDVKLVNLTPAKEVEKMMSQLQENASVQVPVDEKQSQVAAEKTTEKKSL